MPNSQANPWGSTGAYGYTAKATGSKKLNPYYIPKYTQGEGTPTLDEKGRYYWDYEDPNMEASDLARMQDDGNGELTGTSGYVNIDGKRFLRVGDMWEGDASAPKPKLSFDSYGPLTYDEKYGWVADAANVKEAPRPDSFMDKYGVGVVAALGGMVAWPGIGAGALGGSPGAPAGIGAAGLSPETIAAIGSVDPAAIAATLPAGAGTGVGAAGAGSAAAGLSSLGAGPGAIGMTAADTAGIEGAIAAGGSVDGMISGTQLGSLSQAAGTAAGLPSAGFTWKDGVGWLKAAGSLAGTIGSIVNGRYVAQTAANSADNAQLSAEDAKRRADEIAAYGATESKVMQPWDESGGRKLAGDQLQALLKDPMGVANGDPSYKLRQQAAMRAMGIHGQDSGAMGVAAADASSTWYDQRLQQLATLAGATAAPGAGAAFGLNALNSSAVIAGQGQASGEFANQARGAARTTNLNSGLSILNSLGGLVSNVGNLFGNSGSSGPANQQTTGPDALPPPSTGIDPATGTPAMTGGIPLDTGDPTAPGFGMKQPAQASADMLSSGALAHTGRGNFPASAAPDGGGVSAAGNPLWAPTSFSDTSMEPVMRMSSMGNPGTRSVGDIENGGGGWQGANPTGFDAIGGDSKAIAQPAAGGPLQALSGMGAGLPGDYRQSPYPTGTGDLLGNYLNPRGRGSMARGMQP